MMSAIRMNLRANLRSARFGTLGLILLVGVAGGVVLSAAAGARRTETAFPRFLETSGAADALVSPDTGTQGFYADVRKLPQVEEASAEAACMAFSLPGETDQREFFPGVAPMDNRLYRRIERPKLLAGRVPRADRIDEALANEKLARVGHLSVGQRIRLSVIPASLQGAPSTGYPIVTLTIVGIGVFPGEVVPSTELDSFPTLYLTPTYLKAHPEQPGCEGLIVRLRPGSNVESFRQEANKIAAKHGGETGGEVFFQNQRDRNVKVGRAIRPQAIALWLFALLSGATFLIVIGQILSRQAVLAASSNPILRSLGMTRPQLFVTAATRTVIICVGGGLIAVVVAIATSPLMPIGPARLAEPHPGLSVNAGLLAIGFAGVVFFLLAVTLIPMWRTAAGLFERAGPGRSRLARSVAEANLPPSTGIGIGMALEPGRGHNAVPVRSALVGAVLAVAAGVTAVIFGANLDRLISTPALYGWRWDAIFDTGFGLVPKADVARIGEDPSVDVLAGGHYGNGNTTVNRQSVPAVGIDLIEGNGFPRLTEGKPPRAASEVVLGVKTARRVGARLDSTVSVVLNDRTGARTMRVVGIAVFPALGHGSFEPTGLGEGLAVTAATLASDSEEAANAYTFAIIGYKPGTDKNVSKARLERSFNRLALCQEELCSIQDKPRTPADISNYAKVRATPIVLAGAFALLAAATLGHTLVTSVNRRRRDLAVMKTVGFVRRQISMTIAWQASTVAGIALLFGIPIGIAAGRWTWQTFADQLGVPLNPSVPLVPLLIAIPATVVLANVIAAFPARIAGRTRPALVLRSE
jgi:ABC-type lipoprotein release transport system permease subunit